jgi:hypothetical protein
LYAGGSQADKSEFLFNLITTETLDVIRNNSSKFIAILEYLVMIPCIVVGNVLQKKGKFMSPNDREEFEDLLALYGTNPNMMREFAKILSSTYFFNNESVEKQELSKKQFVNLLRECQYVLLKPNEIRKRYTDYVIKNSYRAYLPVENLKRTHPKRDKDSMLEESKLSIYDNDFK